MTGKTLRRISIPLAVVLAAGALVRIVALFALRDELMLRVPLSDAEFYLKTAGALSQGAGWPAGPHFMAPLYPWVLSGLFRLTGPSTDPVQWMQLLLGMTTTTLVFLSARRIDARAALPAGLLYALAGPAIFYENQVLMESLLACLLTVGIFFGATPRRPATVSVSIAGLAFGLATAGRPIYLLLLPVLLLVRLKGTSRRSQVALPALLILILFLAATIPPSLHSSRATGRPTFVTVSGGLNLYIGNHPSATGRYSLPTDLRFLEQDPTGVSAASSLSGRRLDAGEASAFFAAKAIEFLREQPIEAARLILRKAGFLLSVDEIPQIESYDDLKERHPLFRLLGLIGFPLILPLGLLGLLRREGGKTIALASAVVLISALVHLIFFSTARYRAPLLPALAIPAGAGLIEIIDSLRRPVTGLRRLWPVALGLVLLILAPRYDRTEARVWSCYQAGVRYMRIGADRAAAEMYRAALEVDPRHGESWHNLGACAAREGRPAEAVAHYRRALEFLGDHPVTHYNLGTLLGQMGMDERALDHFDRSLDIDPMNPAVQVDRGVALYRLGRHQEAFAEWRTVAGSDPTHPALHGTLKRFRAAGVILPPDLDRVADLPGPGTARP